MKKRFNMKKKLEMLFLATLVCCLSLLVVAASSAMAEETVPTKETATTAETVPTEETTPAIAAETATAEETVPIEETAPTVETVTTTTENSNALGKIEGVRCVDGVKKDGETDIAMYRRLHNTPGEVYTRDTYNHENTDSQYSFLNEYNDMANSMDYVNYTLLEDESNEGGTIVTITARQGAKVSYFKKKLEIETEPDIYGIDEDTAANRAAGTTRDTYYFFVPYETIGGKKGGELLVRVKDGEETQDLKVTFTKPEKKKVKWSGKLKGKLVYPEDSEYGRIELTLNGSKARFATGEVFKEFNSYEAYEVTRKDARDGIKLKFSTKDIQVGTGTAIRQYYTVTKDSDDGHISHTEIGNKVIDESVCYRLGDYTSPTGKTKWQEHFVSVDSYSDTEWVINSTIWDFDLKMKTIKIKVPAQKKAPTVKVNAVKGKIGISDKREYKVKIDGVTVEGETDRDGFPIEWTDGKQGMLLSDLGEISPGAVVKVRVKGTDKKLPSQVRLVTIPSRQAIDLSPISVDGPVTGCTIKISDFNSKNNPYEYTTETPTETTRWKKISDSTKKLGKKAVNASEPVIYIRKKAVNEDTKKKLELRVPSEIAKFTYDAEKGKWTGEIWSTR